MLHEKEIQRLLHAKRVVQLGVDNAHGPLGLEHLAEALARIPNSPFSTSRHTGVKRPIQFNLDTWEKLEDIARGSFSGASKPVTASEVAAAIIEQAVASNPPA
jgi:hypothetical protein